MIFLASLRARDSWIPSDARRVLLPSIRWYKLGREGGKMTSTVFPLVQIPQIPLPARAFASVWISRSPEMRSIVLATLALSVVSSESGVTLDSRIAIEQRFLCVFSFGCRGRLVRCFDHQRSPGPCA